MSKLPKKCKKCPFLTDENYGSCRECECMACLEKDCKKTRKRRKKKEDLKNVQAW